MLIPHWSEQYGQWVLVGVRVGLAVGPAMDVTRDLSLGCLQVRGGIGDTTDGSALTKGTPWMAPARATHRDEFATLCGDGGVTRPFRFPHMPGRHGVRAEPGQRPWGATVS